MRLVYEHELNQENAVNFIEAVVASLENNYFSKYRKISLNDYHWQDNSLNVKLKIGLLDRNVTLTLYEKKVIIEVKLRFGEKGLITIITGQTLEAILEKEMIKAADFLKIPNNLYNPTPTYSN